MRHITLALWAGSALLLSGCTSMSATAPIQFALTVLTSVGVSAALCGLLMSTVRAWVLERLRGSIKHEYDLRMAEMNAELKTQGDAISARLKADIDRESDKLRLTAQSFGEAQKAVISKRLHAVEAVWQSILEINDAIPGALSYFDILLLEEFRVAPQKPTFQRAWGQLDHVPIVMEASARTRKLALLRPYIGEYLWALYVTYQAVILRMVYLLDRAKTEGDDLLWPKDKLLRQHIHAGLGSEALAEFEGANFALVSWVQDRFTHKILNAMENIVAGREFGDAAMKQAELMEARMREAKCGISED